MKFLRGALLALSLVLAANTASAQSANAVAGPANCRDCVVGASGNFYWAQCVITGEGWGGCVTWFNEYGAGCHMVGRCSDWATAIPTFDPDRGFGWVNANGEFAIEPPECVTSLGEIRIAGSHPATPATS